MNQGSCTLYSLSVHTFHAISYGPKECFSGLQCLLCSFLDLFLSHLQSLTMGTIVPLVALFVLNTNWKSSSSLTAHTTSQLRCGASVSEVTVDGADGLCARDSSPLQKKNTPNIRCPFIVSLSSRTLFCLTLIVLKLL